MSDLVHMDLQLAKNAVCEREPVPFVQSHSLEVLRHSLTASVANIGLMLALAASIFGWFSAIRSPLWLDETVSYWQISGGFKQIWSRQGLSFPAYSYLLWVTKSLFGSGEVTLRMLSVLAMLAAVNVLYLAARELFEPDVALTLLVIFCLHPIVTFAAIDARPYACAILIVNCAILNLLRWLRTNSARHAAWLGITAAAIFYFHFLFGTILLAFAIIIFLAKIRQYKVVAPKIAIVFLSFSLVMLPVLTRLIYLVRTAQSHVFATPPQKMDLFSSVVYGNILLAFALAAFFAAVIQNPIKRENERSLKRWVCLSLCVVPLLVLYTVSVSTPLHVFIERYRLVAIPGIALCWGLLIDNFNSKLAKLVFCIILVSFHFSGAHLTLWEEHGYTWKYALQTADAKAVPEHATLLVCSDLPESDFVPMPTDVTMSGLFAPLSYYRVHSPVLPLPRALNTIAMTQVKQFLSAPSRRAFFVVAFAPSKKTVDWITDITKDSYQATLVGEYDEVAVVEFVPR